MVFLLFQLCRWQSKLPTEIEINLITDRLTMKFQHRPTIKKDFLSVGISLTKRDEGTSDTALESPNIIFSPKMILVNI